MKTNLLQRNERRPLSSKFLRLFSLLAMLVVGMSAWGIGLSKEIALPASVTNGQGAWDASSKTLSWTEGYSNVIDVAAAQDLSGYMGITVDSENLTADASFRIILESGDKSYQYVMTSAGVHQILFSDFKIDGTNTAISSEELKNAKIQMAGRYGGRDTRSVKINRLGLIQVKWWGDRKVTISDPNDFTLFGGTHDGNNFNYSIGWHEVRIFLDGSNANEIGSIIVNSTSGNDWYNLGYMAGQQWYPSLESAKAANAKLTEVRIQAKTTGTYNISSVIFTQPFEVVYSTSADVPTGCEWWYTVGDDATKIKETRKFAEGTKITFHASDSGNDHKMINGWKDSEWKNWGATYTVNTLSSDLNIIPEFQNCFRVFVDAENGATATVNKTGKFFQKVDELTFTTTVPDGYTFVGWFENGSSTASATTTTWNKGTYQPGDGITDLTVTAKFKKNVLTIGKPRCNIESGNENGDNYFDLSKLNAGSGVTISDVTVNGNTWKQVSVGSSNGYVSFVFDNPYNLTDLAGWTISDETEEPNNVRGHVNGVEFFRGNTSIVTFNNNAGNRELESQHKGQLTEVTEIRIHFNANTTSQFPWIRFRFKHRSNQLPTLTEGTAAEMKAYYGVHESLKLSNTPGYWRQFTDGTYGTEKHDDLIPAEYKSSYTFDIDLKMQKGDYYFAARDGVWCSLGYDHGQTEWVKVHVNVTDPPTNLKLTYNLNGGTGPAPTDGNTYSYKTNATILGPGSISKEGYYFGYWSLNADGSGPKYSTDSDLGSTTIPMTDDLTLYAIWTEIGFKGWFNFENRLIAQWNFDLSDEVRLNLPTLEKNTAYWSKHEEDTRHIYYTYVGGALNYNELTYDGTNVIPMSAGLKFKASGTGTEIVKILVTKDNTGKISNVQFCLDNGVKLDVPYVRNSYRNDKGSAYAPYQWEGPNGDPTWNYFDPGDANSNEGFMHFQDCLHHLNRDIVYVVSDPDILTYGDGCPITNRCADGTDSAKELFNNGGDENVKGLPDGVHKTWRKCNFTGTQGDRCIIEFSKPIKIDRIAVNRNLVYSFYTENTAVTTNGQYDKPFPGMRLVGNPQGQRVANVGGTWTEYTGAIAVTFGGWPHNGNEYKDGNGNSKTDAWGALNVYQGKHANINSGAELEGNRDYSVDYSKIDITKVPFATDGFPVYSRLGNPAYNETVNPTANTPYHDQSCGQFLLDSNDGGSQAYKTNFNPWTLPCRGAYVKFEPTYPGVLNVDILQDGGATYYIADEFGHLVKDNVYTKVGQNYQVIDKGDEHNDNTKKGHFKVSDKSYVKYSFNVYPGKTYYMFSNGGAMGISGFYFEPYVYRKYNIKPSTNKYAEEDFELSRINVGIKTAEMTAGPNFSWTDTTSDAMDYTNQAAHTPAGSITNYDDDGNKNKRNEDKTVVLPKTYDAIHKNTNPHIVDNPEDINYVTLDNRAVHVTLNRSFVANKWQTIVLPYSMNNLMMEKAFGEGTKVVLLRDVQAAANVNGHGNTAFFVYHMNQDIMAGYPYLIYPTKEVSQVVSNAYLNDEEADISVEWSSAPTIQTINGVGPNIVVYNGPNYGGMPCYDFVGNYKNGNVPATSYVMSNGNLTYVKDGLSGVGAFMAYLKHDHSAGGGANCRITGTNFDNDDLFNFDLEAVGIEDILLESGIVGAKTDVYSIDGQLVRKNTDDLSGLAKGIYIVNGKKYIVR